MYKADLRIGNLVQSGRNIYKVISISTNGIEAVMKIDENVVIINKSMVFKQIPITEEWLEKLGFEEIKVAHTNEYAWRKVGFILFKRSGCFQLEYKSGNIDIKTVDRLQNLYYYLTNEELYV